MRAAPARSRGRCANVARYPVGALAAGLFLGGGGAVGAPRPLSARGGGGLGMQRPFGPEGACLARGGDEGQAALTAGVVSMLEETGPAAAAVEHNRAPP